MFQQPTTDPGWNFYITDPGGTTALNRHAAPDGTRGQLRQDGPIAEDGASAASTLATEPAEEEPVEDVTIRIVMQPSGAEQTLCCASDSCVLASVRKHLGIQDEAIRVEMPVCNGRGEAGAGAGADPVTAEVTDEITDWADQGHTNDVFVWLEKPRFQRAAADMLLSQDRLRVTAQDMDPAESQLAIVGPIITGGKRWCCFEIGPDNVDLMFLKIGVVPAEMIPPDTKRGRRLDNTVPLTCPAATHPTLLGWICANDLPRKALDHSKTPGRFLCTGDGSLYGNGYGRGSTGALTHPSSKDHDTKPPNAVMIQPNGTSMDVVLFGEGENSEKCKASFEVGDRVGVMVDCDAQTVRYFRNGTEWGPGYKNGRRGENLEPPLYFAVDIMLEGDVALLPNEPSAGRQRPAKSANKVRK